MAKIYTPKMEARETARWNKANANLHKVNEKDVLRRQVETVMHNIDAANVRKVIASIALCRYYSAKALETFRRFQAFNEFWTNRTLAAYNSVFANSFAEDAEIGFFLAHGVSYGVYLELANNRKYEAIWPIIRDIDSEFEIQLRKIWQ